MHTHRIAAALLAVSATALLLTGCSTTPDAKENSPTASASTTPPGEDTGAPAAYDNKCDGTQAVISGDGGTHDLTKGCDAVSVASSGSKVSIGATKSIIIEGNNNEVTVASTDTVTLFGSNNTVHIDTGKPDINDQGTGNTVR